MIGKSPNKQELHKQSALKNRIEGYIPTLSMKKAALQQMVDEHYGESLRLEREFLDLYVKFQKSSSVFLSSPFGKSMCRLLVDGVQMDRSNEKVCGVVVPVIRNITMPSLQNNIMLPIWSQFTLKELTDVYKAYLFLNFMRERVKILQRELKKIQTRLNLFEKVIVPRLKKSIHSISIFMSEQNLRFVCQMKSVKRKLLLKEQSSK